MKKNLHQNFVDTCKKCLLFAKNLANSSDKSEQEQQIQSDKMMEIARMCFKELWRINWSKRNAEKVMLVQLMLSNDLYAGQENLEGDQKRKDDWMWQKMLGERNTFLSVQLFEMILSIKSIQKQDCILQNIYGDVFQFNRNNKRYPELYECLINFILGASEEESHA